MERDSSCYQLFHFDKKGKIVKYRPQKNKTKEDEDNSLFER